MGNNPSKEKKNGHAPGLGGPYDDSSATRSTSSRRSKLALDFDPSAQGASSNQGSPVIPISPSLPKQGVTGVSAVGKSSRRFEGDGVYASLSKKGKTSKAEGKEKDDRGWRNPIMGRESGPTTPSPTKPTLSPKPLSPLSPRIPTFQLASESDLTPVVAPVVPEQFSERKPNEDAEIADDLSAARKDGELEEEAPTSSIRPLKSTINVLQPSSNPSTPLKGLGNIPLGAMDDQESARLLVDSLPIGLSLPPALPPPSTPNTSISIVMPSSPPLLTPFPLPSTPMTLEHVDKGTPTIPLNHLPEETVIAKAVPPLELRELGKVVLLGGKGGEGLELEVAQESERAREEAVKATLEEPIVDDKIDVKGLDITHTDVIQALSTVPLPPDDPLPAVPHATLQSPIPTSRYPQTAPLLAIADSVATALPLATVASPTQAAIIADHTVDLGAGPDGITTMIVWKDGGGESEKTKGAKGDEAEAKEAEKGKVYVTGSFAKGWKTKIELRKNHSKDNFSALVKLPPGPNKLKFIVDQEWKTSRFLPSTTDREGNFVNYVNVKRVPVLPYVPGMGLAKPGAFSKVPLGQGPAFEQRIVVDDSLWTNEEVPRELAKYEEEERIKLASGVPDQKNPWDELRPPALPASLKNISAILNRARKEREAAEAKGLGREAGLGAGDDTSILPAPYHSVLNHLMLSPQTMRMGFSGLAITTRFRKKYYTTVYYRPNDPATDTASGGVGATDI